MTVKELCAVTNSDLCIMTEEETKCCWASYQNSLETYKIPANLLNREIASIHADLDPWDLVYLEITLKPLDK